MMKNKIYLLGVVTTSLLIIGSLFKIMHWPGANIILTISIALLIFVFFPAAFISSYRADGKKKKALYFASFITLFFIFLSAAFKIMHWEGASILLFIGILFPIIVFLPVYLYFHIKEEKESLTNFLYIIFFLVGLSAMSGFLAVDVSYNLLADITRVNDVSDLSAYYKLKNEQIEKGSNGPQAEEIIKQAKSLLDKINKLKIELVLTTEEKNKEAITKSNEIQSWKISNKYGKDASMEILVAQGRGYYLKEEVDRFYTFLRSVPEINKSQSLVFTSNLPNLISVNYDEGNENTWYILDANIPLILALLRLTEVENSIRLAGLEALSIVNEKPLSSSNNAI